MNVLARRLMVGDVVPPFSLENQDGQTVDIEQLIGTKNLVIFFYPRDNTYGCTIETCSFRDDYQKFVDAGAEVIGISSDTVDSHHKFATENNLPYTLLSDVGGKIRGLFGVPNAFGFIPGRVTYVIDKDGIIRNIINSQLKPNKHVTEALRVLDEIDSVHS